MGLLGFLIARFLQVPLAGPLDGFSSLPSYSQFSGWGGGGLEPGEGGACVLEQISSGLMRRRPWRHQEGSQEELLSPFLHWGVRRGWCQATGEIPL